MNNEILMKKLEFLVAVFLGITAVLTAWASWQSSLYDGNQAAKYTKSNSMTGEANSLYNEASQYLAQDMNIWNRITELRIEQAFAEDTGDDSTIEKCRWKLNQIMADNVYPDFEEAINWADNQTEYASPFDMDGFIESYYAEANTMYQEGQQLLEDGNNDNELGDRLGLVTVVYAVVLFILGIVSSFNELKTRFILIGVSLVGFIFATVIMVTVPVIF